MGSGVFFFCRMRCLCGPENAYLRSAGRLLATCSFQSVSLSRCHPLFGSRLEDNSSTQATLKLLWGPAYLTCNSVVRLRLFEETRGVPNPAETGVHGRNGRPVRLFYMFLSEGVIFVHAEGADRDLFFSGRALFWWVGLKGATRKLIFVSFPSFSYIWRQTLREGME